MRGMTLSRMIRAMGVALLFFIPRGLAAGDGLAPIGVEVVGTAFRVLLANGEKGKASDKC